MIAAALATHPRTSASSASAVLNVFLAASHGTLSHGWFDLRMPPLEHRTRTAPKRASLSPPLSRARFLAAAAAGATGLLAAPGVARGGSAALAYGSRGGAVRALNDRLAELTFLPAAAVSDRFTDATFHAVVALQKYAGLIPDGIVGRRTRRALADGELPAPATREGGRRIEVSLTRQLAFVVARDGVRRTLSVSTGKPGYDTPTGSFSVYRREPRSWSVPYGVWLPWAAYFTRGVAFHGYPDVPPYAASHGCVRVPEPFARDLYAFAQLGTRVLVV